LPIYESAYDPSRRVLIKIEKKLILSDDPKAGSGKTPLSLMGFITLSIIPLVKFENNISFHMRPRFVRFLAKSNSEREYLAPLYVLFCNLIIPLNISMRGLTNISSYGILYDN